MVESLSLEYEICIRLGLTWQCNHILSVFVRYWNTLVKNWSLSSADNERTKHFLSIDQSECVLIRIFVSRKPKLDACTSWSHFEAAKCREEWNTEPQNNSNTWFPFSSQKLEGITCDFLIVLREANQDDVIHEPLWVRLFLGIHRHAFHRYGSGEETFKITNEWSWSRLMCHSRRIHTKSIRKMNIESGRSLIGMVMDWLVDCSFPELSTWLIKSSLLN